tara:strand:- start:773 stop:1246 length:474 start_codon:yes stop_codon:yes gene_type:complete
MRTINDWLNEYGESHQNPTNKLIHWLCVPIITFTLLGLLSLVSYEFNYNNSSFKITLSTILIIIAILFYIRLSLSIALGMVLFTGLSIYYINLLQSIFTGSELLKIYLAAFIIAWIGQFIGHKIEGKKPSFMKDIQFLLIGPAWLISFIYKKLNISV